MMSLVLGSSRRSFIDGFMGVFRRSLCERRISGVRSVGDVDEMVQDQAEPRKF
jgi:hypothetical protein